MLPSHFQKPPPFRKSRPNNSFCLSVEYQCCPCLCLWLGCVAQVLLPRGQLFGVDASWEQRRGLLLGHAGRDHHTLSRLKRKQGYSTWEQVRSCFYAGWLSPTCDVPSSRQVWPLVSQLWAGGSPPLARSRQSCVRWWPGRGATVWAFCRARW